VNYTMDYGTGDIDFEQSMSDYNVTMVYSYGGNITLANGVSNLTMNNLYDFMQANLSDVLVTVDGTAYVCYVDLFIGNSTSSGSIIDPEASLTFADGFTYGFSGLGGYIDLYGVTAGGGSGGGLPLNIYDVVASQFNPGDRVDVFSTTLDSDGDLVSAAVTVSIYYPNDTLITSGLSQEYSTGRFNFTHTLASIDPAGTYRVEIDATYGSDEVHDILVFDVIPNGITIIMSDVGEVLGGNVYPAKIWITDESANPIDADTNPLISIYDAVRNLVVTNATMAHTQTGVYNYSYTTSGGQTGGTWESVVVVTVNNATSVHSDYWELETAPTQVTINSITDTTVPTITASVTITNEGENWYEYPYEFCIVDEQSNQCNGGDDVAHGSGSKRIEAGQSWTSDMTLNVPTAGDYWFKVVVYWGTEKSGASRQFTATEGEEEPPGGPSVGPSGGGVGIGFAPSVEKEEP